MDTHDLIIIGSGPAGLTAALYAARANLRPLVIGGMQPGGQLSLTTEIENFPGYLDGDATRLTDQMRTQAGRVGAEFTWGAVEEVDLSDRPFRLLLNGDWVSARCLIIATGAAPRLLGLESEERLWGRGISSCATCDGRQFLGRDVAVIGGGDSAAEEALHLSRLARSVTLIHRRGELRASPILAGRVLGHPGLQFCWNHEVVEFLGRDRVEGLRLRHPEEGVRDLSFDGVFLAIGHIPDTELFAGQIERDSDGYIAVKEPSTETSMPGVFAAGDAVDRHYRQAITAAGTGCRAALDAEHFLTV